MRSHNFHDCKLAKAAWHMMSRNTPYDAGRMFPGVNK
jgi:hypothetical protein